MFRKSLSYLSKSRDEVLKYYFGQKEDYPHTYKDFKVFDVN